MDRNMLYGRRGSTQLVIIMAAARKVVLISIGETERAQLQSIA
jgi:hypothetical protein